MKALKRSFQSGFEEQTGETNEQAAQAQDDQKPQEVPDEQ